MKNILSAYMYKMLICKIVCATHMYLNYILKNSKTKFSQVKHDFKQ